VGRFAESFTFTHDRTGGPRFTYQDTTRFEESRGPKGTDLTLPSIMAVSGAAFSPLMGRLTYSPLRLLGATLGMALTFLAGPLLALFASGTVAGPNTRRYHGLLVVATRPPGGRMLGLAAIDPILIIGDRRIPLAVHEWSSGAIDPNGHVHLESFELDEGLPRWRWTVGDVVIEREIAMDHGRASVAVVHRVVRAPGPVSLELHPLCTWRDAHGERFADGAPAVAVAADGFLFEDSYRVA